MDANADSTCTSAATCDWASTGNNEGFLDAKVYIGTASQTNLELMLNDIGTSFPDGTGISPGTQQAMRTFRY
jgi:hypothetical protein